jgi:cytochrome d ubiquinol oxidase subunit I
MQTPAGYKIVGEGAEAKAVVTDFWLMALNPSSIDRLTHVIFGCWLAGVFLVLSISAYYYLKRTHLAFARASMKIGLIVAACTLFLQLMSGDDTARGVAMNQPSKFAAMEGVYHTDHSVPMNVIGWVDEKNQTVRGIQIPKLLSFFVHGDTQGTVTGLDQYIPEDRPPVQVVFQTYHLMVAMWMLMTLLVIYAAIAFKRKKLEQSKWTLRFLILSVAFPQIANQTGWMTAEIGRQPWLVYGLLRTPQGVSKVLDAGQVFASICMFAVIYSLLLFLFLFLLDRKIKHGPEVDTDNEVYRNAL